MSALVNKPTDPRYYLGPDRDRGEWTKSVWFGRAAEQFGLSDVQDRHFLNLWNKREPHGGKLLGDKRPSPDRVPAFEVVLSFDGSMKLLELAPDSVWRTVQECKMAAYRKAAEVIQDRCGWTRLGHGGAKKERADLFMAIHPDLDSRWGGAPLGHCHLTVMGVTLRSGGQTGALDGRHLFRDQRVINAAKELEFANQLTKRLGLKVVRRGDHAALPGNFDRLLRDLSPASETIKREMAKNGFRSPKAKTIIAQRQKPAKVKRSIQSLRADWQRTGDRHGFSWQRLEPERPLDRFAHSVASAEFRAAKHAEATLTALAKSKPRVTERELVTEAHLSAIGKNLSPEQVMEGVRHVTRSKRLRRLGEVKGSPAFVTDEVWKTERRTLRHAQALAKKGRLMVTRRPGLTAGAFLDGSDHLQTVRPDTAEPLLRALNKGPRLAAHGEALRAALGPGLGLNIQARLKAAEQAYREARKPVVRVDRRTAYLVEDVHRMPTATIERLLRHARATGGKVILREPVTGASKAVSGILPQLLDLNREPAPRRTKTRERSVEREIHLVR